MSPLAAVCIDVCPSPLLTNSFVFRSTPVILFAAPSLVHEMYVAEKGGFDAVPADGVTLGEVLLRGAQLTTGVVRSRVEHRAANSPSSVHLPPLSSGARSIPTAVNMSDKPINSQVVAYNSFQEEEIEFLPPEMMYSRPATTKVAVAGISHADLLWDCVGTGPA